MSTGPRLERRRSKWVVAPAMLSAFLVGIAVTRGTSPRDSHATPDAAPVASPAAEAEIRPGPTTVVAGAPAGFAHTPDGAVAAAAAFVTTGQALLDVDPLSAEAAVRQMASSVGADRQIRQALDDLSGLRDALRSGSGPIVFRQGVLATRLVASTDATATVEVWSVGVLARRGIAPPQAGWRTSRLELVWERGDWHLDSETVQPGPAPVLDDSVVPATAEQLVNAIDGFEPVTVTAAADGAGS
jgi:hypothetical protein